MICPHCHLGLTRVITWNPDGAAWSCSTCGRRWTAGMVEITAPRGPRDSPAAAPRDGHREQPPLAETILSIVILIIGIALIGFALFFPR